MFYIKFAMENDYENESKTAVVVLFPFATFPTRAKLVSHFSSIHKTVEQVLKSTESTASDLKIQILGVAPNY